MSLCRLCFERKGGQVRYGWFRDELPSGGTFWSIFLDVGLSSGVAGCKLVTLIIIPRVHQVHTDLTHTHSHTWHLTNSTQSTRLYSLFSLISHQLLPIPPDHPHLHFSVLLVTSFA